MVAKIDIICEASHKHDGEVTALAFDGEHLYSGSAKGVISVWDKNLKFGRDIPLHKDYAVLGLVVNNEKQLYTCGRDGTLRSFKRPWSHDKNDIMVQSVEDDVTCLSMGDNLLYTGDDKGIAIRWYNNKVSSKYNVKEEIKSMAIEGTNLYTVCETNVVITDLTAGLMSQVTLGTMPGRAPLLLFGRELIRRGSAIDQQRRGSYIMAEMTRRASNVSEVDANVRHKYLVYATRDGKGFTVAKNEAPFKEILTKANAHTMNINAMCKAHEFLYTAGKDGKVKKWENVETEPTLVEEIDMGKCINVMVTGPDHTVYVGDAAGFVKRLEFAEESEE